MGFFNPYCSQLYLAANYAKVILCMRPANERLRYNLTSSLIGWAHAQNDHCVCTMLFQYLEMVLIAHTYHEDGKLY